MDSRIFWNNRLLGRIIILTALAGVLSTVFVVDNLLWKGMITAKYFWFATAVCVAVPVTFLFGFSFRKRGELRITDIAAGLFAVYVCVNYYLLNRWPDMHWWLFLLMIPLYIIVRVAFADKQLQRWLPDVLLAFILAEAVWGLLQLYGFTYSQHSLYKITGSLFNPGPFSGFVAVSVPLALSHLLNKGLAQWERWLGAVTLAASVLILPAAMSRAAWIAALAGCIPVVWNRLRAPELIPALKLRLSGWRRIIIIFVSGIVIIMMLTGIYLLKKDSADGRWLIWRASTEAVKEHPLFGSGYGRFAAVYGDAQASYFLGEERSAAQVMVADSPEYAFNEYVQITVELGIAGLVLFLFTVSSPFITRRSPLITHHSSLITLLVFAAFSYPFSVLPLGVLFVFLLAISASSSQQLPFTLPVWLRVAGMAAILCIVVYNTCRIFPKREAYREWLSLQMLYNAGAYKEAAKEYRALYPLLQHEKQFLFEYGQCLSKAGQYDDSNRIFEQYLHYGSDPMVYNCIGNNAKATNAYQQAEKAYIRASKIVPNRHYPLYLLMKLYQETGQTGKAKAMAKTLLDKPVKVKSTAIREMQEEAEKVMNDE